MLPRDQKMVFLIKDNMAIYGTVFAKIDIKQHKNTCLESCLRFLKEIEKFLHFSFKTVGNFSDSKLPTPPPTPGKDSWTKPRLLGHLEQCSKLNPGTRLPWGWSGLELTDAEIHYRLKETHCLHLLACSAHP